MVNIKSMVLYKIKKDNVDMALSTVTHSQQLGGFGAKLVAGWNPDALITHRWLTRDGVPAGAFSATGRNLHSSRGVNRNGIWVQKSADELTKLKDDIGMVIIDPGNYVMPIDMEFDSYHVLELLQLYDCLTEVLSVGCTDYDFIYVCDFM